MNVEDIRGEIPNAERGFSRTNICAQASCGFSYVKTSSGVAEDRSESMRRLLAAVVMCIICTSIEVAGGIKSNSLAVLTYAVHLLSDLAAFAISLFTLWTSGWEATPRHSYGFFRIEVLGALVSIQLTWVLSGILVYEAVVRLVHETGEVQGFLVLVISGFGLAVNVITVLLLGYDRGHHDPDHMDLEADGVFRLCAYNNEPLLKSCWEGENQSEAGSELKKKKHIVSIKGSYPRVLKDCIQTIGVMIAGAVLWYQPGWKVVDSVCAVLFSATEMITSLRMVRNILEVLMESTPREIDTTKLKKGLCEMDEVDAIHELHIWAVTVGKVLLACHVKIKPESDADMVLDKLIDYIWREYNISHVTIQIERG